MSSIYANISESLPWENFPCRGEDGRCGDRRPLLLVRVLGQTTVQRAPLASGAAAALEPGHEVQGALRLVGWEHLAERVGHAALGALLISDLE